MCGPAHTVAWQSGSQYSLFFPQNILADETEFTIGPLTEADLAGCPVDLKGSARQAAEEKGFLAPGQYIVTLSRSLVEPFLTFADRRDLRQQVSG